MKKFLLITTISVLSIASSNAQDVSSAGSWHSFVEWNIGIAAISDFDGAFPGTSVLWGTTYIGEDGFIIEFEAGLALPTIATAKIGMGKKFGDLKLVVGARPWPFNFYFQQGYPSGERGYWITSFEYNPFPNTGLSFDSNAIFNFGYRWNIGKNK